MSEEILVWLHDIKESILKLRTSIPQLQNRSRSFKTMSCFEKQLNATSF